MLEKAQEYLKEVASFSPKDEKELESFRIRFLSKKGIMNDLFASFKTVPNEQKKAFGQVLNQLKQAAQNKLEAFKDSFDDAPLQITDVMGEPLSIPRVHSLEALGSVISDDGRDVSSQCHRLAAASRAFYAHSVCRNYCISVARRQQRFFDRVVPVALYGAGLWSWTVSMIRRAEAWESSCLMAYFSAPHLKVKFVQS